MLEKANNRSTSDRYAWVDFIRGFCILIIVICHTVKGSFGYAPGLQEWFTVFMINTFFILSGLLAKETKFQLKEIIRKRFGSLIIPYILYSVIILMANFILFCFRQVSLVNIIGAVYKTIVLSGIGTLWFIPVLFGVQLIFNYVLISKNYKVKAFYAVSLLGSICYVIICQRIRSEELIFQVINAPLITVAKTIIASVFFYIGYIIKPLLFSVRSNSRNFVIGLIWIFSSFLVGRRISGYDFNQLILPNPIKYILVSMFCSLSLVHCTAAAYN